MGRVGVIGGGAFGTAMACVLRRRGHEVVLWAREPEVADTINAKRENAVFLRGVTLPEGIVATAEMAAAARDSDFVLLVPPAQHMRAVTASLQPHLAAGTPVISCSKGIERGSCALMSQVLADTLPQARVAILSGPSFAAEIAVDLPAGVTLACADPVLGARLNECAEAMLSVEGRSAQDILGSPDDKKLRSCATLFASVAAPGSVFERLLEKYFAGKPDVWTVEWLKDAGA